MPSTHYDVIIVGGRPAGSALAIRLGQQSLRVLLLERAVFPSPHPVLMQPDKKFLEEIV
jgi:flavin-dependent dehydrogenase